MSNSAVIPLPSGRGAITPPWYKTEDMPPPYTVNVRVMWDGREFVARRGRHPQTGKDVWAAVKAGGQLEVIGEIGGSFEPSLWQPLFPDKWAGVLPEPVTLAETGRMVAEKTRFLAVDEATSEELAMEMERDREAARVQANPHAFPVKRHVSQFWRDITQIRYEPPGSVTKRNCEGRVLRAVSFCGGNKFGGIKRALSADAWSAIADAHAKWLEAFEALRKSAIAAGRPVPVWDTDETRNFMRPLPEDLKDFDFAMGLFTALNPVEFWKDGRKAWAFNRAQKVVFARSLPKPPTFADLAGEYNIGDRSAAAGEQLYDRAINQCVAAANGKRIHAKPVVDQIAALKERNRAYRRQQ